MWASLLDSLFEHSPAPTPKTNPARHLSRPRYPHCTRPRTRVNRSVLSPHLPKLADRFAHLRRQLRPSPASSLKVRVGSGGRKGEKGVRLWILVSRVRSSGGERGQALDFGVSGTFFCILVWLPAGKELIRLQPLLPIAWGTMLEAPGRVARAL